MRLVWAKLKGAQPFHKLGTLGLALALALCSSNVRRFIISRVLLCKKRLVQETEQEKLDQDELSHSAPPQAQPLGSVEELLLWQAAAPAPGPHPADPGVSSLLSKIKGEQGLGQQVPSPAQVDATNARAASRARHTAFCAAPTNSSLPPSHSMPVLLLPQSLLLPCGPSPPHHVAGPGGQQRRPVGQASSPGPPSSSSALADPLALPSLEALPVFPVQQSGEAIGDGSLNAQQQLAPRSRPKLLVCHDMQGGYLDDRFVQGTTDHTAFRMWRWDCIDIFVYFSHNLVTIPPPCWISAAHRHNTKVLGTFITEWNGGSKLCKQLFSSRSMAQQVADQLVRIAQFHGFEGWLINIECDLLPALKFIPHLLHFLAHLRARMREVCGNHAAVIWYDAVTTDGRLRWQNTLNPLNYPFLDASDGLFINYHWKSETPAGIAAVAGSRASDVFLGVDVHGRGTFGGGKASCNVALLAARMSGVSAAIFGPGWVHENFPDSSEEEAEAISESFWQRVAEAWGPRPPLQSASPSSLPFVTSFCEGRGKRVWLQGSCVSTEPWHNLSALDLQPALLLPSMKTQDAAIDADASYVSSPRLVSSPGGGPEGMAAVQKAWLALHALYSGSTALQHGSSHTYNHTHNAVTHSGGSGSALSEGSVSLCRDVRAFQGASCLRVQPPCPANPPLIHPLYHTHILIPTTGLTLTFATIRDPLLHEASALAARPAPSAAAAATPPSAASAGVATRTSSAATTILGLPDKSHPEYLAIALWILPSQASAISSPTITAITTSARSLEACRAAGLSCVKACPITSGSSSSSPVPSPNGSIHAGGGAEQWQLWRLHLPPGSLPVGAVIAGVGIVCWSSARGHAPAVDASPSQAIDNPAAAAAAAQREERSIFLGHLALSCHLPSLPSSLRVSGLTCSNLTTCPVALGSLLVSCDVCWHRDMRLSGATQLQPSHSSYHVWVRSSSSSSSRSDLEGSKWLWLGTAYTERFHCALLVCNRQDGGQTVCRPQGQAIQVLEGRAPAADTCEVIVPKIEIAVQPVLSVDGLVSSTVNECSRLSI